MLKNLIDAAICRNKCDVVLKNANVVNVYGGDIIACDIGIVGDRIVGLGKYNGKTEYDLKGKFVLPGLIDAHVHIESSQLCPESFASLVVPHGTTTVIADPHEIVNVCGIDGLKYINEAAKNTPLEVKLMLPSCVPATPFETSGAVLDGRLTAQYMQDNDVFGLGEFMNYPAVMAGDSDAIKKLESAKKLNKVCDGHAPALTGNGLNAYLCGGIRTDHECIGGEEIKEKIARGMYVMLRHGSSARNLEENCKFVNAGNARRFLMCTDDRHACDLKDKGHIDDALRTAVANGVDPVTAVTIATLNAAECYLLKDLGAVAPNYIADLCVCDDLKDFKVSMVFKSGKLVAENGKPLFEVSPKVPDKMLNTVRIGKVTAESFKLSLKGSKAKVITMTGGSLITGCSFEEVESLDNDVILKDGLLKLAVLERHGKNGNIGLGLLKDFGFKGGAIGITVSHDSHNLIIAGDDNAAMAKLAEALQKCGGGLAIAKKGEAVEFVPLEIGGLMTSADPEKFIKDSEKLYELAFSMGVKREFDAFLSLAFLSLAVIPHLKLLDTGLFDVDEFKFTDINA